MLLLCLILFVFGTTNFVSGAVEKDATEQYCFQFTWLGHTTPSTVNCSEIATTPCILPFVVTKDFTQPNVNWMWDNLNHADISCPLTRGLACIKYSYIYNNAVLNTSYFCGKVIEDETTALTSGCYTQTVSGHTIEVCACQSDGDGIPCNSSVNTRYSLKMLIILTFISIFMCNI